MDKFGHEPLHYPDEIQPDKHRHERDPKEKKPKTRRRSPTHAATPDAKVPKDGR